MIIHSEVCDPFNGGTVTWVDAAVDGYTLAVGAGLDVDEVG
jgi:hypothetical protein